MTGLANALRRQRGVLTITGLSAAIVTIVLSGADFLHLTGHGGAHINAAVRELVGLVMLVCIALVLVLSFADNADEKRATPAGRVDD